MHMADALVSPAVGATMAVTSAAVAAYCAKKVREENDPAKVPLMGVMGAFVFAAQMVNFTIPGTGSSGHLGGGLILAIVLGPEAAVLVMASVLTVQALFFADGGLLALGTNIFNLGIVPAFVAYPVFRAVAGQRPSRVRVAVAGVVAAEVALLLGASGVVAETAASGVSALPVVAFALLMLPIHAAIGSVEGLVTSAVVAFVRGAQPDLLDRGTSHRAPGERALGRVVAGTAAATGLSAGVLAWFASTRPDGLETSVARLTGGTGASGAGAATAWPAVDAGTSVSGLVGAAVTLAVAAAIGLALRRRRRAGRSSEGPA